MEYYNQNKKDWLIVLEEKYRKLQNWKYGTFSFYVLFPSIPASIIKLKLHFGINAFTKTLKYLPENLRELIIINWIVFLFFKLYILI